MLQPTPLHVRQRLLHHAVDLRFIGHISQERQGLDAKGTSLPGDRLRLRLRIELGRIAAQGSGLFTRLAARNAAQPAWQWVCEKCDVPDCEHRLRNPR